MNPELKLRYLVNTSYTIAAIILTIAIIYCVVGINLLVDINRNNIYFILVILFSFPASTALLANKFSQNLFDYAKNSSTRKITVFVYGSLICFGSYFFGAILLGSLIALSNNRNTQGTASALDAWDVIVSYVQQCLLLAVEYYMLSFLILVAFGFLTLLHLLILRKRL